MKSTLLIGTRKGLVVFEKIGGTWTCSGDHFLGIPVSYAMEDPRDGTWWAALDHGHWGCKLHYSHDRGHTWTEVAAPQYPEGAEISPGKPAALQYIWSMEAGLPSQPGRLYIGTDPGGLFRSDDHGQTWVLDEVLWNHPSRSTGWFGGGRDNPGIHSICIDPADPDHLWIGISVAGVFETRDGGQSWAPLNKGLKADFLPDPDAEVGQDPHLLVSHPQDPNLLWQQNHCGIFRSKDGARTWSDISEPEGPANFGFAIALDEEDQETAWVVPAISDGVRVAIDKALCVCRTTDGGATWQAFREGLPQQNCYDIVYRHALTAHQGEVVFGSTTGNLYVSGDRGESWSVLASYLPLIYSIRYAK